MRGVGVVPELEVTNRQYNWVMTKVKRPKMMME